MISVVTIGDIADVFNGKTPSKNEQRSEGLPILKIKDVTENGEFKGSFESFVDTVFYKRNSKKKLRQGDSLILNAAHNADYVGSKQFRACEKVDGVIATGEWLIVRPKPELADSAYVNFWLKSDEAKPRIRDLVKGIHLYPKDVVRLEISLPSLEEQKRIAAILDKADSIRRKRQQAIDLTDQLLRSVFLDMFGDPVMNPKGWDLVSFGSVGQLDRGKSKHRPRNDPVLLGGIHPLIQTGDVANSGGYISEYKSTYSDVGLRQSKKWPIGTLCITIAANIANTGILEFDACFPDSIVGFTPIELVTVEYVQAWLGFLQKIIEDAAPESAQKNINLEILRGLVIPLPDIELQKKFSHIVHHMKSTKEKLASDKNEMQTLFTSLTQRAFRGELNQVA